MKNTHIPNLLQEVPKDIRLEVYKEALDLFNTNTHHKSGAGFGLCLLLPCLLWNLDWYLNSSPNKESWDWRETSLAFPELTKEVIKEIQNLNDNDELRKLKRIEFLKDSIKQLS